MNKNKVDEKSVDEAIRSAEGSLKFDGQTLNEEERQMIKEHLMGNCSDKEFIEKVKEYSKQFNTENNK